MKLLVVILAIIYVILAGRGLVKRDKELFGTALACWGAMMLVTYFVFWPLT